MIQSQKIRLSKIFFIIFVFLFVFQWSGLAQSKIDKIDKLIQAFYNLTLSRSDVMR